MLKVITIGDSSISTLWFLNPCILAPGEITLYTGCWFRASAVSWGHFPSLVKFVKQLKLCILRRLCHCYIRLAASGWWEIQWETCILSAWVDCRIISAMKLFPWLKAMSVCNNLTGSKTFCKCADHGFSWSTTDREGKSICRIMFASVRTNYCRQAADWPSQWMVLFGGVSTDLCLGQVGHSAEAR